jgi:hypothetical protein
MQKSAVIVLLLGVGVCAACGGGGKNSCWQFAEAEYECACVNPGVKPDSVITQADIDRWCSGDYKTFAQEFESAMFNRTADACDGAINEWAQANLQSGYCGSSGYWECSLSACDLTTY